MKGIVIDIGVSQSVSMFLLQYYCDFKNFFILFSKHLKKYYLLKDHNECDCDENHCGHCS